MATTLNQHGQLVTKIHGMHAKHLHDLLVRVDRWSRAGNWHRAWKAEKRIQAWLERGYSRGW